MTSSDVLEDKDLKTKEELGYHIIVFNDSINTFAHVIECFVGILNHSEIQAEQCAIIIHEKGSCKVKNGAYEELIDPKEALCECGIDAKIRK